MSTTTRRIGPADHGRRMTLDEFAGADFEEGWRYELARGVIDVTNVPGIGHGMIVYRLARILMRYADEHPGAIAYQSAGSDCRLRLPGMQSDRHPDQAVYLSPPPPGESPWTDWTPELVVEVVSPGGEARDLVEKREEYLLAGVREYWILEPASRTLHALRRLGDGWDELEVPAGSAYRTDLLPGLELRTDDLFGPTADE